jgi:hypothetical protein
MRRKTSWLGLLFMTTTLGCAGSGPSKTELTGTWHATSISYESTTGLGQVDIMTMGATFELQLNADNTGVLTFKRVGGHVDVMTGTWESSVDILKFTLGPGNDWTWDMSMSGDQLRLDADGSSWDFNDDGNQEPASWHLVLAK